INGVLKECLIAACLTALMILLFLGSWRSTLVVATSIPLSILCSIIILSALGQTMNVMTLGGLALAVGILVDDATVEIENIHRNLGMEKPIVRAILDGAREIATPAFVSTLAICIVFVPVVFLSGAGKYLFTPLALAVVVVSASLFPFLGEDFFPDVDAGQFRLHVRGAPGTRIEETEQLFAAVEDSIRRVIPASEIDTVLDDIGIPAGGVNLAFTDSSTVSAADGEILVALNREHHGPTARYVETLRSRLRDEFPTV